MCVCVCVCVCVCGGGVHLSSLYVDAADNSRNTGRDVLTIGRAELQKQKKQSPEARPKKKGYSLCVMVLFRSPHLKRVCIRPGRQIFQRDLVLQFTLICAA